MTNRKYPAQKTTWFGVYRKMFVLGSPMRSLEAVVPSAQKAADMVASYLKERPWGSENDYIIENVEVKMGAWQPFK